MKDREIFVAALEIEDPESIRAFLNETCGDDQALRSRVEELLAANEVGDSFLNTPALHQIEERLEAADNPTLAISDENFDGADSDPELETQRWVKNEDEILLAYLQPSTRSDSLGRLAHYEVLEVLGRGAFGTVLKAFDEKLHRVVAIKVLSPEMAATSPARKRFLREARASAAIRHENVVGIHAVENEPIPYLVMEYIPGKTLQERLDDQGPLDLPDVLNIGKQIADGLAAAHAQDLIHRDVKPGNILLDDSINDQVKITDFGLARTADDASMTQSGVIAGTPLYMAPEQAMGQKLDQRADLFSFGTVLYQMITGRPPFRARTTMAVLKRVTEDTSRPIKEIIPETPEWLCQIVDCLLAKNPNDRFDSAKEVGEILRQCLLAVQDGRKPELPFLQSHKTAAVRQPADEQPGKWKSFFRSSLAKAAALILILLVGLGITEAAGVTKVTSTVIRLATGSGTLVIETDDPSVQIAIDGEEVTIRGGGVAELTLRPGEHKIAAFKNGRPVKQELVTITRNGRTVLRMSLEPTAPSNLRNEVVVPVAGKEGWVSLINGRDLSGWKTHPEQPGNWRVEHGVMVAEGPPITHLYTERSDFTDFHIYMEVQVSEGGDSGLYFRSPYGPSHEFSGRRYPGGYEVQIRTDDSGSLVAFQDTRHQLSSAPLPAPNSWIALEVIAIENHLVIRINGHVSLDFHDNNHRYGKGHLALQCAGDVRETKVQVRKLLIKEFPAPVKTSDIWTGRPNGAAPQATLESATGHPINLISPLESAHDFLDSRLKLPNVPESRN